MDNDYYLVVLNKKDFKMVNNQIKRLEVQRVKAREKLYDKNGKVNTRDKKPINMNVVGYCKENVWFYNDK